MRARPAVRQTRSRPGTLPSASSALRASHLAFLTCLPTSKMWIQIHNLPIFTRIKTDDFKCLVQVLLQSRSKCMTVSPVSSWPKHVSVAEISSGFMRRQKPSPASLCSLSSPYCHPGSKCPYYFTYPVLIQRSGALFPFPGHTTLVLPWTPQLFQTSLSSAPPLLSIKDAHSSLFFSTIASLIMMMTTVMVSMYWNLRARHYTETNTTLLSLHFLYNPTRKVLKRYLHLLECHSMFPY